MQLAVNQDAAPDMLLQEPCCESAHWRLDNFEERAAWVHQHGYSTKYNASVRDQRHRRWSYSSSSGPLQTFAVPAQTARATRLAGVAASRQNRTPRAPARRYSSDRIADALDRQTLDDPRDTARVKSSLPNCPSALGHVSEDRSCVDADRVQLGMQCAHRAGVTMLAIRGRELTPLAGLIRLVLANNQIHPLRHERDIGTIKHAQRRTAKAADEAGEQQPCVIYRATSPTGLLRARFTPAICIIYAAKAPAAGPVVRQIASNILHIVAATHSRRAIVRRARRPSAHSAES